MADEAGEKDRRATLWQLSRDEQRILLITFAGGLGSIIIGAAIIGLAVALAKYEKSIRYDSLRLLWAALLVIAWSCFFPLESHVRKRREKEGRPLGSSLSLALRTGRIWLLVLTPLLAAVLLLWLVGIAAGIH